MDNWLSKVLTDITNGHTINKDKVKILLDKLLEVFQKNMQKQIKGNEKIDRHNTTD